MESAVDKEVTYKYKWRFLPAACLIFFGPLCIWLGVASISQQGWQGGGLFLLISLTFVVLIDWLLIMGLANISIDKEGISRKAFGVTWQKMPWCHVTRITIVPSKNPEDGKLVKSLVFVASKHTTRFLSRRIAFQERMPGMEALLTELSSGIARHKIPVVDLTSN